MTYSSGGLIQATDYNGFVSTTSGGNVNATWGTGSGDSGWGQTALSTVSGPSPGPVDMVTATQWASLVNTVNSMGSQTNTSLTSRTAPVAGDTISIFSNLGTDITNCYNNRGNAASSGTISSTWTGNVAKTTSTGNEVSSWTITFTHTITFPSADQARYFWNAGGLIRLDMNKTSTGNSKDSEWNSFVASVGTLFISGRVAGAAQTIGGTSYTGVTRSGGTGTPSPFLTTTGWYSLTGGAAATTIFQLNAPTSPYSGDYVSVTAAVNAGRTELTLVVTWYDAGAAGGSNTISGGTDTTSPYSSFGTAPAVLCRYVPPSTTYLTNSWGTPSIASSVNSPPLPGVVSNIFAAAGGGGGSTQGNGFGGGGGGGEVVSPASTVLLGSYTVVVGAGGAGESSCQAGNQTAGSNSTFSNGSTLTITATAGGRAPSSSNCGDGSAGGGTSGKGWNGGAGSGFGSADGGGGGAGGPGGSVTQTLSGNTLTGPGTNYGGLGITTTYGANFGGGGTRLTVVQIGATTSGYNYGGGYFAAAGTVNTGGGGGGGGLGTTAGSTGGSGVVVVRYAGTPAATGGTISQSGGYTYHTFTSSGTFATVPAGTTCADYLVVAGGGGGRGNGGPPGGGGGTVTLATYALLSGQSYVVTVGAGGTADSSGGAAGPGGTSSVAGIASSSGGTGGGSATGDRGGNSASVIYGTTTNYTGGTGWYTNNQNTGVGAGAGAGANGETVPSGQNRGGTGGIGYYASSFLIAGTDVNNTATTIGTPSGGYYGGGGGGGYPGADFGSFSNGLGGAGGGGGNPVKTNTGYPTYGQDGLTNTGGGGQGGSWPNGGSGGAGGSGVVVIRYLGTPLATGGTISQVSGYTYHTFTSSGTFSVT